MITKTYFDTFCGEPVWLYTLKNQKIQVGVLNFGAVVNFIRLETSNGVKNICVGYNSVRGYLASPSYCGATVGRVANRIAGAQFSLNGKTYALSANEGGNCLHGGGEGFDKKMFKGEIVGETLALSLVSPDGDMGFPGRLDFRAEFTLEGDELSVVYRGESDKDTYFSPTCHVYFNLNGGGSVENTLMQINARYYTPAGENLLPLGKAAPVAGTPLDFTLPKTIGAGIAARGGRTYDDNFCIGGVPAARAQCGESGVSVQLYTDMPGLQFYVGCAPENEAGGGQGFCLEPQFYPNAANIQGFEPPLLRAGSPKDYHIRYRFSFR